jgi:serine/threonine protein phosphatase 1
LSRPIRSPDATHLAPAALTTAAIDRWQPAPAHTNRPIFAIGDVHGRYDLLTQLHETIAGIVATDRLADPLVVHLGDYIDRGPQPLDCLKRVLGGVAEIETVALAGNHEQFMYRCLAAAEAAQGSADDDFAEDLAYVVESWFAYNCGTAVARELGFADPQDALDDPWDFHGRLIERLGDETLARFRAMPNHHRTGDYFFIHGGLHPAIDLAQQLAPHWGSFRFDAPESDPLWVRGPFLTHPGTFEFTSDDDYADYTGPFVVVHGHTISHAPEVRHNRIGVDTGAFMTGRLTAVELRGDQLRFVTAQGASVTWGEY